MPRSRVLVSIVVLTAVAVRADDRPGRHVEAVTLPVDTRAEKRMAAVRDLVAEGQWAEVRPLVEEIVRNYPRALVSLDHGRYVDVRAYVNLLLCGLPPEGLAAIREEIDTTAAAAFETAARRHDVPALERLARESFLAGVTDDALLLLGDLACADGRFDDARRHWMTLVPLEAAGEPGVPRPVLRYPDSDLPAAAIQARLVAVSLLAGDLARARREFSVFAERFPEAEGRLLGGEGRFVDRLLNLYEEVASGPVHRDDVPATTFGGTPGRNHVARPVGSVGGTVWSATPPVTGLPLPVQRPLLIDAGPLTTHPLVWRDVALVPGEDRILAWHTETGAPWPDPEDTPELYRTAVSAATPRRAVVGVPRFTLSQEDGLLYARMGSPITGVAASELADVQSEIVCLDLARGEGTLLARIPANRVMSERGWMFEGTPVVRDGHVFALMRRIVPQTEIAAVQLELRPVGRRDHEWAVRWFTRVCGSLRHVAENQNVVTHLLPTLVGNRVIISTDLGAIVGLDATTGEHAWAVTYDSEQIESPESSSDHTRVGLTPAVAAGGSVFVAPQDTRDVFALDERTGRVLWRRPLPEAIRHVLGVDAGRVIASGDSLWALDARTGRVAWAKRRFEPEEFGYGRGVLAGSHVWWPTRDGIAVVDTRDGLPAEGSTTPHLVDLRARGLGGGNLVPARNRLLVARPHDLAAVSLAPAQPRESTRNGAR